MKERKWYTLERHHNLWTIWKHHESDHGVGVWGVYTDESRTKCLEYAKANKIKVRKCKVSS